jgi:hypothetical protein
MCPITLFTFLLVALALIILISQFGKVTMSVNDTLQGCGGRRTSMYGGVINADGRDVAFHYTPRSKNSPAVLRLTLTGNFYAHAVFHTESSTEKFAKGIGLNREVQTNDPMFDNLVYIECEDKLFIDWFLKEPDTRQLLLEVLRTFTRFEIDGCRAVLVKTPCDDLALVASDDIRMAAQRMAILVASLPPAAGGQASSTPNTDEARGLERFFIGVVIAIVGAGVVLLIWGLSAYDPVMKGRLFSSSLYVSLPLAALAGYYFFNQLKGLSTSMRSFSTVTVTAVAGLILCCWGGAAVLNGMMDISPAQTHECNLSDKWISHSKNSTTYHVRVSSWDPQFPSYQFSVSHVLYDRLTSGDPCQIISRAGYLGFEWVTSRQCHSASEH